MNEFIPHLTIEMLENGNFRLENETMGDSYAVGPVDLSVVGGTTLAIGASCTVTVQFAPTAEGPVTGSLAVAYTAPGATSPLTAALTGNGHIFQTSTTSPVSGSVPATLGLSVTTPSASFGNLVAGQKAQICGSARLPHSFAYIEDVGRAAAAPSSGSTFSGSSRIRKCTCSSSLRSHSLPKLSPFSPAKRSSATR